MRSDSDKQLEVWIRALMMVLVIAACIKYLFYN